MSSYECGPHEGVMTPMQGSFHIFAQEGVMAHVYMCVYMCACLCVYVHVCVCVCMCARECVCACACKCRSAFRYTYTRHAYIFTYIHTYKKKDVYNTPTCTQLRTERMMNQTPCLALYGGINTLHTYIHTHKHKYIHT